jgi:hypothetical protein
MYHCQLGAYIIEKRWIKKCEKRVEREEIRGLGDDGLEEKEKILEAKRGSDGERQGQNQDQEWSDEVEGSPMKKVWNKKNLCHSS